MLLHMQHLLRHFKNIDSTILYRYSSSLSNLLFVIFQKMMKRKTVMAALLLVQLRIALAGSPSLCYIRVCVQKSQMAKETGVEEQIPAEYRGDVLTSRSGLVYGAWHHKPGQNHKLRFEGRCATLHTIFLYLS